MWRAETTVVEDEKAGDAGRNCQQDIGQPRMRGRADLSVAEQGDDARHHGHGGNCCVEYPESGHVEHEATSRASWTRIASIRKQLVLVISPSRTRADRR